MNRRPLTRGERRRLRAAFEWWWNLDRRPRSARSGGRVRPRRVENPEVIAAMGRQLLEIRNLPEHVG